MLYLDTPQLLRMHQAQPVHTGLLTMQLDPKAERVVAIDRTTLEPVFKLRASANVQKKLVELKYTVDHNLMILLLDDTNEHDAECVDFVKAEAIELTTHTFA